MSSQKRYHHGTLREELLRSALILLDRDGLDAVTVRAVARQAKVAHSAPANHFANRSALLRGMAIRLFEELDNALERQLSASPTGLRPHLQVFAATVASYAEQYPHRYRLLWRRDVTGDDEALDQAGGAIYARLCTILAEANCSKRFDLDTYVVSFWSLIHGYLALRLDGIITLQTDTIAQVERIEAMIDLLTMAVSPTE